MTNSMINVPPDERKNLRIVVAPAEILGQMYETLPVVVNLKKDKGRHDNFVRYAAHALGKMAGIFVPTAAAHA